MNNVRAHHVPGKTSDLTFLVVEKEFGDGQYHTAQIEGDIRLVPGRANHKKADRSAFDHHGHLIADQFGGPTSAANIVPMHGFVNGAAGEYGRMEQEIREGLDGGRTAFMQVRVVWAPQQYAEKDRSRQAYRPYVFNVVVRFPDKRRSWQIYNFGSYLDRR